MNSSTKNIEKKVLDHGLVRLVDCMPLPSDSATSFEEAVVQMARVSYGSGTKTFREDLGLIRYLLENDHTSPFEGVTLKFHLKMPIFVARQWIRHRTASLNEYSARYSVMDDKFYIPEPERLTKQSSTNKQGSSEDQVDGAEDVSRAIREHSDLSYKLYETLLEKGLSRELARVVLPVNVYTEMYWVMNLHNLLKFLRLRMDPHAQYEIRVFSEAIYEIVSQIAPNIMNIWESSQMNSVKFTKDEVSILSKCVSLGSDIQKPEEWSTRRFDSFKDKIKNISNQ